MKVRRKIMALGTALAMAFVMIASLVMVTDVKAAVPLPDLDPEIEWAQYYLNSDGTFTAAETENTIARFDKNLKIDDLSVNSSNKTVTITNMTCNGMDIDRVAGWTYVFSGTNSLSDRLALDGFKDNPMSGVITIGAGNNSKLTVGSIGAEGQYSVKLADGTTSSKDLSGLTPGGSVSDVVLTGTTSGGDDPSEDPTVDPTTPTEDTSTVTTVTDGSSATITPSEDGTLSFRIDKPLSYFEDGGELYIDGTLIERSQYTYKEGSTIITLVKELATKLSDGAAHVFKVKFNDGTEVTSNITVGTAAAASSTAATTGTAASSTAATTTKVTSPKTADVLPIAGIALVFVGATAIGVIAFRRKNL